MKMIRKGAGRKNGGETGGENIDGTDGCRLVNENGKKRSGKRDGGRNGRREQ